MSQLIKSEDTRPSSRSDPAREISLSSRPRRSQQEEMTLSFLWGVLKRRKGLVCLVAAAVLSLVTAATLTMTPLYRSSAKIRIQPESAHLLPYPDLYESSQTFLETEAYLETQCELLRSETLARRVVERLQLADHPHFRASEKGLSSRLLPLIPSSPVTDPAERLVANLEVEPIGRSRVVKVSYLSPDPQLAAQVVNTLADEFMAYNIQSRYASTSKASEFLQVQLRSLKKRIEESEKELVDYVRSHDIVGLDASNNIILQRLADLNARRTQVETDLILKRATYTEVREISSQQLPQGMKTPSITALEARLQELTRLRTALSVRYGSRWPELVRIAEEIAEVEQQLVAEREQTLAEAVEQARMEYSVARHSYDTLMGALKEQKELAAELNEASIQYSILRREVETNKQVYEGLLQRLKEAGVTAGLAAVNIQLVDPGKPPWVPDRPNLPLNLGAGLLLGLLSGFGLALVLECTDKTLKTPEDLEESLNVRCLGIVPRVRPRSPKRPPRLLTVFGSSGERLECAPQVLECYKTLRTGIVFSRPSPSPRTILVTSALPGEGKTTTAANLAIVLAQTNVPTLVVDMDLRKPSLGAQFGMDQELGLSLFLQGESYLASQICETAIPNLHLLPAGPPVSNPAELVGSERMRRALSLLRNYFGYIVMDTSPVLAFTDTVILSPLADTVLLVVRGGKTRREAPRRALTRLGDVNARVVGAVINDLEVVGKEQEVEFYGYYPMACEEAENAPHGGRKEGRDS